MTTSNGDIFRVTGHLCGEFTGHRWIPRTKASNAELWLLSFICAWINGWVNNREAGDLKRHRAHYDATVILHQGVMTFGTRTKRFSAYDSVMPALEQLTLLTIYNLAASCVYVIATLSHKYVRGGQNKMVDIIFIQENLFQNIVWKSFSDDILK